MKVRNYLADLTVNWKNNIEMDCM